MKEKCLHQHLSHFNYRASESITTYFKHVNITTCISESIFSKTGQALKILVMLYQLILPELPSIPSLLENAILSLVL